MAGSDPRAVEVLRVWASPDAAQQLTLNPHWRDPGAWGLLLVDLARHVAQAYAQHQLSPEEALARIFECFDAERAAPTDDPEDITNSG